MIDIIDTNKRDKCPACLKKGILIREKKYASIDTEIVCQYRGNIFFIHPITHSYLVYIQIFIVFFFNLNFYHFFIDGNSFLFALIVTLSLPVIPSFYMKEKARLVSRVKQRYRYFLVLGEAILILYSTILVVFSP